MKTSVPSNVGDSSAPSRRAKRTATIGGVQVTLRRVGGKGDLSTALIKRIIRAARADSAALKA